MRGGPSLSTSRLRTHSYLARHGYLTCAYREGVSKSRVRTGRQRRSGPVAARWAPAARLSNLDSSGLPRILFPADVTGSHGPDFVGLRLDLVITSPDAVELKRLPLRFDRSLRTSAAMDLWGFDSTQALVAHFRGQRSGSWALDMRTKGTTLTASQALMLLELQDVISPPNRVSLAEPGTAPRGFSGLQQVSTGPPPPEGLSDAIRALARLEEYVGEPIVLPDLIRQPALSDLQVAAQLLNGETVHGQWNELGWPVTAAQARDLSEGALGQGPAVLDIAQPFVVDLGSGQRYELSHVWYHYHSVRVSAWPDTAGLDDDTEVVVPLVPADAERAVELRFEQAAPRSALPGRLAEEVNPVTFVPAAVFDELVASLDVEDEPAPALARAAERLRAIR